MKSEELIRRTVESMINGRSNFTDPQQLAEIDFGIHLLRWVLGEGPQYILVPKPAPKIK